MDALPLVLQVITLAAIVATSAWGSRHIDDEARIRARAGATGLDWTMSKKATLVLSPVVGVIVLLGTSAARDSANEDTIGWLGLAVQVIFLLAHWSSVRRAAR